MQPLPAAAAFAAASPLRPFSLLLLVAAFAMCGLVMAARVQECGRQADAAHAAAVVLAGMSTRTAGVERHLSALRGAAEHEEAALLALLEEARRVADGLAAGAAGAAAAEAAAAAERAREAAADEEAAEKAAAAAALAVEVARASGHGARHAIFGMAHRISREAAGIFVRSLRRHMPCGDVDVFLFADAASLADPLLPFLYAAYGVTVVPFEVAALEPATLRTYHPSSLRWPLIRDHMERLMATSAGSVPASGPAAPPPYTSVLFTDVRDVYFQDHVFRRMHAAPHAAQAGLVAFLEARPRVVAECAWNAKWVRDCFGDAALSAVGHRPISCSGTTLATWGAGLAYARLLADFLVAHPSCEKNGVDQGVHNFFLHSGGLAEVVPGGVVALESNEEGFVTTVQAMSSVRQDDVGRVVNDLGVPVALVHQYDRMAELAAQYAAESPLFPGGGRILLPPTE
jgi:hypothetical protein